MQLPNNCLYPLLFLFIFCFWGGIAFSKYFCSIAVSSLYGEYTVPFFLSFGMVFFYLVTTRWIFYISLCKSSFISINQLIMRCVHNCSFMNLQSITHETKPPSILCSYYPSQSESRSTIVVVSRIQRICCQPGKLLYTLANPARGLLNKEKRITTKSLAAYPPTLLVRGK